MTRANGTRTTLKSAKGKDLSKFPLHTQIALGGKPKKPNIRNKK